MTAASILKSNQDILRQRLQDMQSERGGLELQIANLKQREQSIIDEMADIKATLTTLQPVSTSVL